MTPSTTPPAPYPRPARCETCAIPWDIRRATSVLDRQYKRKYPDCPIQALRDAAGASLVGSITEKISCAAWVQIECCQCGKPIDGRACDYCGRPYCVDCLRVEEDLDEQQ